MTQNPELVRPEAADWSEFLAVAGEEGWRVPATELDLFRGPLADSALALRFEGRFAGLVTFVNHDATAWIGNLILRPSLRGRGFGNFLFDRALLELAERRAASIWLTASESGYPIYRRRGFQTVGCVERWVLPAGRAIGAENRATEQGAGIAEELRQADARTWGGHRPLLDYLLPAGRIFSCGRSLALLQLEPGRRIVGPWYSLGASTADDRCLLADISCAAHSDEEIVADVLAGAINPELLEGAGFIRRGVTRLMALGDVSFVRLENLVSLASLGSMG
jgi:GNAT superfamily N-acetyltransferase